MLWILFIFIGFFYIKYTNLYVKTSTLAAVMAIGIMTRGVLSNYFTAGFDVYGEILVMINVTLWLSFLFSLGMAVWKGKFKELHLKHPINRFGIGTWVAASSICGILLYIFNDWFLPAMVISIVNIGLWLFYIVISLFAFYEIHKTNTYHKVHGIILLTTVSTQSMVLILNTIFPEIPVFLNTSLLLLGFLFYGVGIYFIGKRYIGKNWSLKNDWNNTNCILHGALSISGIACIISGTVNPNVIVTVWIVVFAIYIIVEMIEVIRLYIRIKHLGLKQGILVYDVTQWSRIFTFAMFDTFTFRLQTDIVLISHIRHIVLSFGIWFILSLIVIEVFLSLRHLLQIHQKITYKKQTTDVSF
ncbi:hypothetical protein [Bacillus sp. REN16]|uniref:hypothetical protein n=1 Tax=Bacillus sp. REN16 TaxID=2887296 RepID=UPI001E308573|nr:hypothetical protein [Bacillus sp. REN16]MCC3357109.1 hypothetical protein [Bacillus sp. REN16]